MQRNWQRRRLLREVNERIRELETRFGPADGTVRLLCECGGHECRERVEVRSPVYDDLRRSDERFVVAAGHERPHDERVVAGDGAHVVVTAVLAPA